jgi:hypothetical protein
MECSHSSVICTMSLGFLACIVLRGESVYLSRNPRPPNLEDQSLLHVVSTLAGTYLQASTAV